MTEMTSSALPGSNQGEFGETAPPEPPDSERVTKLSGENARLRSEIRQALARAQRAEADAIRVRGSTKFQVGDLLVKAARHPRRLLALPRDLLRLYRLRGHRRTQPGTTADDTVPGRARRSDYTDEIAARLLLPRVAAQPRLPLAVAGALDPLTAAQWRTIAAVTPVLPHDAATLIRDVDPDVVVIDTAAAGPSGSWSHLADPAATDRALAARDLITAARGLGRPVMLLRSGHDSAGFDAIGATCDLVVNMPGSPAVKPWQPGIDLGIVMRLDSGLLLDGGGNDDATTASNRVFIVDDVCSSALAATWSETLAERDLPLHGIDPTAPEVTAIESAVRSAAVVAVAADHHTDSVGAPLPALLALAAGRRLVGPDDADLRSILGLSRDADPHHMGWFPYRAGDITSARRALDDALAAPRPDFGMRWTIWRALFERASAPVAWQDAVNRLGLGCQPLSQRQVAWVIHEPHGTSIDPSIDPDIDPGIGPGIDPDIDDGLTAIIDIATARTSPIREIICHRARVDRIRSELDDRDGTPISVIGVAFDGDPISDRTRAAQASRSHLLCEITRSREGLVRGPSAADVVDAIIAHELADSPGHVHLRGVPERDGTRSPWMIRIVDRDRASTGSLPPPVIVDHPGRPA